MVFAALVIIIVLLLVLATLIVKEQGTLWFNEWISQDLMSLYLA